MAAFRFSDRRTPLLSGVVMLLLLVLAGLCWRERTWLLDVAFQTFLMVKDESVQVMVYRFGAATVQSLPLLGIKLGVSLPVVSWLYSVSFHLHFLAFFLLAALAFRREDIALAIAVLYTAMTYDGFYWQTSELQQGLGFLLVSWAALLRYPQPKKWWHWAAWSITLIALAFYHPLVFLPFYFFLLWHWWKPSAGIPRRTITWLGAGMLVILLIKQTYFQNWYDLQKTGQFKANLIGDFPNYFSYPAYNRFLENLLPYWWGYALLFIILTGWLAWRRRWWGFGLLISATGGFLLLTAIGDPETLHRFYAEVNYYPLLAFLLVPFIGWCRQLDEKPRLRPWFSVFFLLFFVGRLLLIYGHGDFYRQRIGYLRQLTTSAEALPQQRLLIASDQLDMEALLMDWGLPYESLIQSASDGNRPLSLLPTPLPEERRAECSLDSLFVTPWTSFPLDEVNENPYWQLKREVYGTLSGSE